MANLYNPEYTSTPGEILFEEYMQPMNLAPEDVASYTRMTVTKVNKIINAEIPVDMDIAMRLGKLFGTSAEFWLNLQNMMESRELLNDPTFQSMIESIPTLNM